MRTTHRAAMFMLADRCGTAVFMLARPLQAGLQSVTPETCPALVPKPLLLAVTHASCGHRWLQSLHTTVLPLGTTEQLYPLEVHIRTDEMHRLAEYGIAVDHWAAAISGPPASLWSGAASAANGAAAWRESLPAMATSAGSNGNGNGASVQFEPQHRDNGAAAAPVGGNGRGSARRRPPLWRRLFPPVLTRIGAQPANAAELGNSNGAGGGYDVRLNGSSNGAPSYGSSQLNGATLYPRKSGGNGASPPGLNGSAPSLNGASASTVGILNGSRAGLPQLSR